MNKPYDVCIIGGLGHVGLPLGITFADKGLKVCLHDLDDKTGASVMNGKMPFVEYGASEILKKVLKEKNLSYSSNPNSISMAKFVVITIGTPIDEFMNPKIGKFLEFIKNIKKYIDSSQTLIVRSSVAPGTCEQALKIIGSKSKWKIAYCPERIVQGYAIKELSKLPQIVSGFSKQAEDSAKKLFKKITNKIIVTSIKEAEMAKLFSNAWRYVQFALANQFFIISNEYGVDYNSIRSAMVEGYERASMLPGAGFAAGPCLLKDTMQLANTFQGGFNLGYSAMMVNEGLPNYIVEEIKKKYKLKGITVGILGMSFKAEIDDFRDSLSFKLRKILLNNGSKVICSDEYGLSNEFVSADEVINKAKFVIIAVPHKRYKKLKFKSDQLVVDLWNISSHSNRLF